MEYSALGQYDALEPDYNNPGLYPEETVYPLLNAEQYGEAEYTETQTILADGGDRFGVSSLCFDHQEELLWMGNQGGHVTSYYSPAMQKYTSFQAHACEGVRDITTFEEGILILTQSALRVQMRRGIPIYTHSSPQLIEMQTMMHWSPGHVLLAGHQSQLIDFNFATGQEAQVVPVGDNGCAILRAHNKFICGGDSLGKIKLLDPATLKVEQKIDSHSGSLSDMDIHGNLLVTCGFSQRPSGLSVDQFLMVYDLRMMRLVSPITVMVDPFLLRFLPSFSSRLAVVSTLGQMQLVDAAALTETELCVYQINTATSPLCLDISPSNQFLCIGDAGGEIHLFGSANAAAFNRFARETEFADAVAPLPAHVPFDGDGPLYQLALENLMPIGLKLANDWPEECMIQGYRPTPPIDPKILKSMKIQGPIGYAPNPMTSRRNQVPYKLILGKKAIADGVTGGGGDADVGFMAVPKRYRKIELKHISNKEDADYKPFNRTSFCGLEAHLPNNYCNVMLEVLYFLEPVRYLTISHLCKKEFCLCCELGFLFVMMDKTRDAPCQANNFLRAFRTIPEASALGLILNDQNAEERKRVKLMRLIQNWNQFILHQLHAELLEARRKSGKESSEGDEEETPISQLFGIKQNKIYRCLKCATEIKKRSTLLLANMICPTTDLDKEVSFSTILEKSLCTEQTTPAWCDTCNKFRPTLELKRVEALPHILSINCGLDNQNEKEFWLAQIKCIYDKSLTFTASKPVSNKACRYGQNCTRPYCRFKHPHQEVVDNKSSKTSKQPNPWIPSIIQLITEQSGNVICQRLTEEEAEASLKVDEYKEVRRYDLVSVVCHITENEEKNNLIAFVRVGPSYHERSSASPITQWYLFNNFSVSMVPEQEVTWFSTIWKIPCVLYYVNRELPESFHPAAIPNPISVEVFSKDKSLARERGRNVATFTPLNMSEMPKKGELVAMDAEFVTLNQEEAELRSDGKLSRIKPSHMSVARITCIRGQGPLEGTAFMDDYICTQEQVVDYLTKFSGIKPGDLDANISSKHLTTLKSSYLKLRFLVDTGVIFVGHGLRNDFRVINISVPNEQVIDTVRLFHLPHQRMVSLKFLAWHFLGTIIQSETHDSVEDARTALQLYFRYKQLQKDNKLSETLKKLYEVGKLMHWKVPDGDISSGEWDVSDEDG